MENVHKVQQLHNDLIFSKCANFVGFDRSSLHWLQHMLLFHSAERNNFYRKASEDSLSSFLMSNPPAYQLGSTRMGKGVKQTAAF